MLRTFVVGAAAAAVLSLSPRLARAQAPSSPLPLPAAGHIPESVPMVPVHLNGADGLSLEMQPLRADRSDDVDDDAWRRVCDAPCDRPLPTTGTYRVTGPGTSDSDDFRLKAWRDQPAILDVSPTSNAQRRAGTGLIVSGSIILGIGGLVTTVDLIVASATTGDNASAALGVGIGGVVAGAAMLIVGLTLHTSTAVKQEPPPPSYGPPAAAAAVRLPAPSSAPLFTATF